MVNVRKNNSGRINVNVFSIHITVNAEQFSSAFTDSNVAYVGFDVMKFS